MTIPTQNKAVREEKMLQVLLLLLHLLLSLSIQTRVYLLPYQIHRILQENQCDQKETKRNQAEKLEDFISCRSKSKYLFMRHVICQANTGLQLAYHI